MVSRGLGGSETSMGIKVCFGSGSSIVVIIGGTTGGCVERSSGTGVLLLSSSGSVKDSFSFVLFDRDRASFVDSEFWFRSIISRLPRRIELLL